MRFLILMLILTPSIGTADTLSAVTLGKGHRISAWLHHKRINKTETYLMGYQTGYATRVEIVVPENEYSVRLAEMNVLVKSIRDKEKVPYADFCTELATVENAGKISNLCLDKVPSLEKRKLVRWIEAHRDFVIEE